MGSLTLTIGSTEPTEEAQRATERIEHGVAWFADAHFFDSTENTEKAQKSTEEKEH